MAYKTFKNGPPKQVTFQPSETLEFCDGCGRQMPEGVFPRFEVEVEYTENLYPDQEWHVRKTACSPACVLAVSKEFGQADWPPDKEIGDEMPERPHWSRGPRGRIVDEP